MKETKDGKNLLRGLLTRKQPRILLNKEGNELLVKGPINVRDFFTLMIAFDSHKIKSTILSEATTIKIKEGDLAKAEELTNRILEFYGHDKV